MSREWQMNDNNYFRHYADSDHDMSQQQLSQVECGSRDC